MSKYPYSVSLPSILCGPYNPMFFRYVDLIKSFIAQMKLEPVSFKVNPERSLEEKYEFWWKFGGIKVAHLHYNDHIYMLDENQWKTFSKNLLEAISKNLAKASAVSFENALEVADRMENVL